MLVLGIESSCDETAAAVVKDGRFVVSNVVSSQVDIHKPYGGVVPELAGRAHIRNIVPVVGMALEEANVELADVDGIAVTVGPGLVGALLVGINFARNAGYVLGKPVAGVHHLAGHLNAIHLEQPVDFPFLGLVASGGHTSLFRVEGPEDFKLVGKTRDDAAGEAFDKVAKLLGLGYPGGAVIEKMAKDGDPKAFDFPRAFTGKDDFDFSFSGLKTAVARMVNKKKKFKVQDVAASFQEACVGAIVAKTVKAARKHRLERAVLSGGVAANSRLRNLMAEKAAKYDIEIFAPSVTLCADNAAMIAAAGTPALARGESAPLDLDAQASWSIG